MFKHYFENPWSNTTNITQKISKFLERYKSTMENAPIKITPIITLLLIIIIPLLLWLSTGFYMINTNEEGVVLRLGEYHRTTMPGLNYKLPDPFESVEKISVTRINKELIGTKNKILKDDSEVESNTESQMLTKDENIIETHFFVQWSIKKAEDYLFNVLDDVGAESTIRVAAESVVREVIGTVKLYEALSEQRQFIEEKAKTILQDKLDQYKAGIRVDSLGILYSYVAFEVRDAYRDVQSAKADKERDINQAHAYRNNIIPKARGESQKIIEEAIGYKNSIIAQAKGEVERFNIVYSKYRDSKEITKERMRLEAMESIFKNSKKVVIDSNIKNGPVSILSLNEIIKKPSYFNESK